MTRLGDRTAGLSPLVLLFVGLIADVLATVAIVVGFAGLTHAQHTDRQVQMENSQQITTIQQAVRDALIKADDEKASAAQTLAAQSERQRSATCALVATFASGPQPTTPAGQHSRDEFAAYGRAFGCP